jgi:hypothetical protein
LLFSDEAQFQLTTPTNTALTPKTTQINQITKYSCNVKAKPVGVGQDVYFSIDRGNYSGVLEYYVQPQTFTNEAADVTAHVPKYLPTGVYKLIGSSIYDIVFAISTTNRNKVYVYKFYWGEEDKKAQSSWSEWALNSADVILGGDVLGSRLYLAIQRSDGVFLEYIDLQAGASDSGMGVLVHLDRKTTLTGSYNAGTNTTTWTLPYSFSGDIEAVLGSSFSSNKGKILTISRPLATTLATPGDYSSGAVYVGVPYTFSYTFSPFYFKDESKVSVEQYKMKLRDMEITYENSGFFKVDVTPYQRDTSTYITTGQGLGTTAVLGDIPVSSGSLRVPLFTSSEGLEVTITNDSWLPCYVQSAEWNAKVSYTFKRV